MSALIDRALAYREMGLSVIPVRQDKKPALLNWKRSQIALPDVKRVRAQFSKPDVTGVAIVCGGVSGGLAVRDFDEPAAYATWAERFPDLATHLPTVQTARGKHVYFLCPTCKTVFLDDGELRATGAYVVAPPSLHPTGVTYEWEVPLSTVNLSVIDQPWTAGLIPPSDRENREDRGDQRSIENTEAMRGNAVDEAILSTLPLSPGTRHRAVFDLCRALKVIPSLEHASPEQLEPIVRRWHALALPVINTKPFEETWIDFLRGWERVKFPKGSGPLDEVVRRVEATPPPKAAERYEQPAFRRLVSLCRELQRSAGDQPFFLSVRKAGRLLNVSHDTAANWLWLLRHDGILQEVEKGQMGRASRYRYIPNIEEEKNV